MSPTEPSPSRADAAVAPARLPPPVREGDRVGVAALSGPADRGAVEGGLDALADLGFDPVPAPNLRHRDGLYAGSDEQRLAGLHDLAADPNLSAVLFLRGGYGAMRLLPSIDWDLLGRHPRAWVGYSDLTPLLLELVRRTGVVAFHGPMVATDLARGLDDGERESLLAALAGDYPRELAVTLDDEDRGREPVSGPLVGGCLSLLTATLGTPWAVRTAGALLFVEDVSEPLYRLDRMLTHLGLSGNLSSIHAMIFGHLGCLDAPQPDPTACIAPLRDGLPRHAWPVAWGLPAGHQRPNHTLPLGLSCRLEPARGSLVLGTGSGEAA